MGDYNNPIENNNQQPNVPGSDQPQNQPQSQQQGYQQPYQQPPYQQAPNQQPPYQQPQYQQPQYGGQTQHNPYQQPNQVHGQYQQANQGQYQQPRPQGQYQQPYQQYQPKPVKKMNGMVIASLVCGIASVVICCIPGLPLLAAIAGLILGIMSLKKNDLEKNDRTMAIVGIVLSGLGILLGITYLVLIFLGMLSDSPYYYYWY